MGAVLGQYEHFTRTSVPTSPSFLPTVAKLSQNLSVNPVQDRA